MTLARESVWRWILTEWTLFIYLLFALAYVLKKIFCAAEKTFKTLAFFSYFGKHLKRENW